MNFLPVRTKADLDSLDQDQILEGYISAKQGDPEPGPNRGRSYWHGWRNRMIDMQEHPLDDASLALIKDIRDHERKMTE